MRAQIYSVLGESKGEKEGLFLEGASIDLSLNCLLHMWIMLTTSKVFIILFLPCLWKYGMPWQLSKQISKLLFQMSVGLYCLLDQMKVSGRPFLGGGIKGEEVQREITSKSMRNMKRDEKRYKR